MQDETLAEPFSVTLEIKVQFSPNELTLNSNNFEFSVNSFTFIFYFQPASTSKELKIAHIFFLSTVIMYILMVH